MSSSVRCVSLIGIDGQGIEIETQIIGALKRFAIVGLPDGVLREAKDRVRCAIENSGFLFPHREVVVSLAPASVPKTGSGFDLAIALSILAADGQIDSAALKEIVALGELGLDGSLRGTTTALATAVYCRERNLNYTGDQAASLKLLTSDSDAKISSQVPDVSVIAVRNLFEAVAVLNAKAEPRILQGNADSFIEFIDENHELGFNDVVGQDDAKRAFEVSAAGGHNLLMIGPPGAGKSMLAKRMLSLLPPLNLQESIDVARIYAALSTHNPKSKTLKNKLWRRRPFRSPHHSLSTAGLIGGGSHPKPGEISMAHCGVLFLDEFAELRRDSLEALREPLETRCITISRAQLRVEFPANFILVAAMNPCPCGKRLLGASATSPVHGQLSSINGGIQSLQCRCSQGVIQRYIARISGPIADRIDLKIWVPPVPVEDLQRVKENTDLTEGMKKRVQRARIIQATRFNSELVVNAQMGSEEIKKYCKLSKESQALLSKASKRYQFSARGYTRVCKLARTIADLKGAENIEISHLSEALMYRM